MTFENLRALTHPRFAGDTGEEPARDVITCGAEGRAHKAYDVNTEEPSRHARRDGGRVASRFGWKKCRSSRGCRSLRAAKIRSRRGFVVKRTCTAGERAAPSLERGGA